MAQITKLLYPRIWTDAILAYKNNMVGQLRLHVGDVLFELLYLSISTQLNIVQTTWLQWEPADEFENPHTNRATLGDLLKLDQIARLARSISHKYGLLGDRNNCILQLNQVDAATSSTKETVRAVFNHLHVLILTHYGNALFR